MTQAASADTPARPKLGIRTGSSRKLLERKAREQAESAPAGERLEDSFPADAAGDVVSSSADMAPDAEDATGDASEEAPPPPAQASPAPAAAPPPTLPPAAPVWSAEDESAFQSLTARRKAAGYQRRGRDVADQMITLGAVTPNPGTIVAVIVALVAERGGSVGRAELVAAMAGADFPHGKARPDDKGWCQGYVAGAVRNGFLALADAEPAAEPVAAAA
ncbi:hypothetical protein [Sphingomonas sp.]|uniref:hypothetical protein n=1 Tax=Sphingomonas sp. TaxID=28214 RepID=UPI003B004653